MLEMFFGRLIPLNCIIYTGYDQRHIIDARLNVRGYGEINHLKCKYTDQKWPTDAQFNQHGDNEANVSFCIDWQSMVTMWGEKTNKQTELMKWTKFCDIS